MPNISKYKSDNICILEQPISVNILEWAYAHPNCDALVMKKVKKIPNMTILAYGLNTDGNMELCSIVKENKDFGIFSGMDESLLNFSGGVS